MGYGAQVHYCLGEIEDVSYAFFETSCCCDETGVEVSMNCCDEKTVFVQLEDEHQQPVKTNILVVHSKVSEFTLEPSFGQTLQTLQHAVTQAPNAPPERLFTKHCALIFYA